MSNSNIETQINADALKSEADSMRDDVMNRWREIPNIVAFRPA
jgi:hypothetical protein